MAAWYSREDRWVDTTSRQAKQTPQTPTKASRQGQRMPAVSCGAANGAITPKQRAATQNCTSHRCHHGAPSSRIHTGAVLQMRRGFALH